MIEFILTYLNDIVGQLGYFTSINGIAEKIRSEDKEFPAVFAGKEFNAIEFDYANGISYWRKNGDVRMVNIEDGDSPSCATYQDRNYPLRLVYMVPKSILQCADAYTCDNIAETLCNNLAFNNSKTLAANLNAENVSVLATSFNANAEEVWDEEFKGVEFNLPTDMCFVAIDFEITVRANIACFANWTCNTVVVTTPEGTVVYENGTTNASNCGADGTFGLFKDKSGNVLNFYSLAAGSDNVTLAYNEETCALEITVTAGDAFTCEDVAACEVIIEMQSDLSGEIAARVAADLNLQTNITAEASTRAAADTAETNARIAATTNSAILAKLLTGLNISGSSITSTDDLLTAFGKLQSQINGVLGGAIYQGTWAASTNTPSLANGSGTKGYYYVASDNGSVNFGAGAIDFNTGDWAIYNGAIWQKVDNTDAVSSVNGFIGAVNLTSANISEVTNLYFTTARVLATALTGYTSGAGVVAASDTILQAIQKLNGNIAALTTANVPDSSNRRYVTDAQLTVIGNTSGTNSGNETNATIGAIVTAATNYATPLNADQLPIYDALNSILKKVTWANIVATLKTALNISGTYTKVYAQSVTAFTCPNDNVNNQAVSVYIPANTLAVGDRLRLKVRCTAAGSFTRTAKFYLNTVNNTTGSPGAPTTQTQNTATTSLFGIEIVAKGAASVDIFGVSGAGTGIPTANLAIANKAFNLNADMYLMFYMQKGTAPHTDVWTADEYVSHLDRA